MHTLTVEDFKTKVFDFEKGKDWKYAGDRPAIIDFYADWCGPCRMQAPVLEEIAREYEGKLHVYKINTEESPELAALFRIRGIPALLFIPQEGKPSLTSGFTPKDSLKTAIHDLLRIEAVKKT